jgi:hypothetical protein
MFSFSSIFPIGTVDFCCSPLPAAGREAARHPRSRQRRLTSWETTPSARTSGRSYKDGSEELYDRTRDPDERTGLASRPQLASVKMDLATWLPKHDEPKCSRRPRFRSGIAVGSTMKPAEPNLHMCRSYLPAPPFVRGRSPVPPDRSRHRSQRRAHCGPLPTQMGEFVSKAGGSFHPGSS